MPKHKPSTRIGRAYDEGFSAGVVSVMRVIYMPPGGFRLPPLWSSGDEADDERSRPMPEPTQPDPLAQLREWLVEEAARHDRSGLSSLIAWAALRSTLAKLDELTGANNAPS